MPRGPSLHPDVLEYLITFIRQYPKASAGLIQQRLQNKFKGIPIPEMRTIQKHAKRVRDQLHNIQEQPWSLAMMDKAGIPSKAVNFLLEASIELQKEGHELWLERTEHLKELQDLKILKKSLRPQRGVMSNRQAKWLWRLHLALPTVELHNIVWRAAHYADREMVAEYLDWEFDSSDLDASLRNLLRNIRERETNPVKEMTEEQWAEALRREKEAIEEDRQEREERERGKQT